MNKKEVVIADVARRYHNPIAELVQLACQFTSAIFLVSGSHRINAKSIMGIMALNPCKGKKVLIEAEGEDEDSACEAMENFLLCR